jgi:hypothetical protein
MMQFIRTLVGVKGQKAGQQIVDALVEMDPRAATEAQLRVMERDLDEAGRLLTRLRTDFQRELKEAQDAQGKYARMLAAAEHLNGQVQREGDPHRRAGLEASLAKLIAQLEELQGEVGVEQREAEEAEALVSEAEAAFRDKAKALTEAKTQLTRAQRDMERATIQEQRERERADRAAQVAGLRSSSGSKLTTAVDAMKRRADEARANAESARMKAAVLTQTAEASAPSLGDANIRAALEAVGSGGSAASITDRLSALRARTGGLPSPQATQALPSPSNRSTEPNG